MQTRFVCFCFSSYLRHIFSYAYEYWCTGIATSPNSDIIGFWILKDVFSSQILQHPSSNMFCVFHHLFCSVLARNSAISSSDSCERQFFSSLLPNSLFSRQVYYRSPLFPSKYTIEPNFEVAIFYHLYMVY